MTVHGKLIQIGIQEHLGDRGIRIRRLVAGVSQCLRGAFSYSLTASGGFFVGAGACHVLSGDPGAWAYDSAVLGAIFCSAGAVGLRFLRDGRSLLVGPWRSAWRRWRVYPRLRIDLARHEAGHALLGRALGLPYTEIRLWSSAAFDHGLAVIQRSRVAGRSSEQIATRMVLALVAGRAAERASRLREAVGYGSQTDDFIKADELGLMLAFLGRPHVPERARIAVKDLFATKTWRAALDEMALAATARPIDIDDLDAAIERHRLDFGLDGLVASCMASNAPVDGRSLRQTVNLGEQLASPGQVIINDGGK